MMTRLERVQKHCERLAQVLDCMHEEITDAELLLQRKKAAKEARDKFKGASAFIVGDLHQLECFRTEKAYSCNHVYVACGARICGVWCAYTWRVVRVYVAFVYLIATWAANTVASRASSVVVSILLSRTKSRRPGDLVLIATNLR